VDVIAGDAHAWSCTQALQYEVQCLHTSEWFHTCGVPRITEWFHTCGVPHAIEWFHTCGVPRVVSHLRCATCYRVVSHLRCATSGFTPAVCYDFGFQTDEWLVR
jgi:hypothetical protein